MSTAFRRIGGVAIAAVALVALAGCTAGSKTGTSGSSGIGTGISVIVVGGPLSDPFFGSVNKGAQDAAHQVGAKFEYAGMPNFDNPAVDLVNLTETGIAKHPDVMVIGDFIPDAQAASIKKAVAAGITVVIYNSGLEQWEKLGAIGFIGEDARASGVAAGAKSAKAGVTNGVCVDHVPENPVLNTRCQGYISALQQAGGQGSILSFPSSEASDPQGVTQKIQGYLNSHPDVNGIFTLGATIAAASEKAVAASGRDVKVGTTDLSQQVLTDVKSGKLLFSIDQQGYVQTFYGVTEGIQNVVYGLHPIGAIMTSPLVITKDNVDKVLAVNKKYGVRGAK